MADKPTSFNCNECKQDFQPEIKEKKADDLLFSFFTCPHCREIYIFGLADQELREKVDEMRKVQEDRARVVRLAGKRGYAAILEKKIRNRIAVIHKRNRELMDLHEKMLLEGIRKEMEETAP